MISEIAKGFGGPDDLALLPDGEILFSDVGNGTINRIALDGKVTTVVRGLVEPEGIVVLPDGSWIIAEQGKNRLVRFDPKSNQTVTWLSLPNKTGKAGVDGIVRDAASGDIIVPDSPNGTVLRVSADGKSSRVIATGFARPTGADIERDGSIVVADENGGAVKRIRADGRIEKLGRFSTPDDAVVDSVGNIFVVSLGDNSVQRIDAQTGAITLIAHVQQPQGIVVDADENLIVTKASLNRILRIKIH